MRKIALSQQCAMLAAAATLLEQWVLTNAPSH